jgi:hypothetical protein
MKKYISYFVLYYSITAIAWSQSDSIDYLPLRIGNSWIYQFYNSNEDGNSGGSYESGKTQYSILSNVSTNDSTIWTLREERDYIYTYRPFFPGQPPYVSYPVKDTSIFQLIEYHNGNHRIVRSDNSYKAWKSAFPFSIELTDTIPFNRYYFSRLDTINVLCKFRTWTISSTFQRNIGVTRMDYSYYFSGGFSSQSNLVLQNSVIMAVQKDQIPDLPNTFILKQNYPNPFNPMTTISFQISKQSKVRIYIYDVSGKIVSSVYDSNISLGVHSFQWNANDQSSGIYFCKVEVEGVSKIIKLALIK